MIRRRFKVVDGLSNQASLHASMLATEFNVISLISGFIGMGVMARDE